jgi:hypothetical protein
MPILTGNLPYSRILTIKGTNRHGLELNDDLVPPVNQANVILTHWEFDNYSEYVWAGNGIIFTSGAYGSIIATHDGFGLLFGFAFSPNGTIFMLGASLPYLQLRNLVCFNTTPVLTPIQYVFFKGADLTTHGVKVIDNQEYVSLIP